MEPSERHESGNFSTFIAGALVGAGVALLFAPRSGSQMRGLLRGYAACAKDELADAVDRGTAAWGSAKDGGQEFVEKGKESLREADRQAKGLAEVARKTVNEIKADLAAQ
jgi:gas vesicle protein